MISLSHSKWSLEYSKLRLIWLQCHFLVLISLNCWLNCESSGLCACRLGLHVLNVVIVCVRIGHKVRKRHTLAALVKSSQQVIGPKHQMKSQNSMRSLVIPSSVSLRVSVAVTGPGRPDINTAQSLGSPPRDPINPCSSPNTACSRASCNVQSSVLEESCLFHEVISSSAFVAHMSNA